MLDRLPKNPGVYIFKGQDSRIIYIGKAKSIRKRVGSYFQKSLGKGDGSQKIQALLHEYVSIDYIITASETEALLLEAQLIRDYRPKYNILLKYGQPFLYILFTKGALPQIKVVRNKKMQGKYFGPFLHKLQVRKVFEYLVSTFRLSICNKKIENGCLDYHIGLCAGSCKVDFDKEAYLFRLQLAQDVLKNKHAKLLKDLKNQIRHFNQQLAFEKSKFLQEYIDNLDIILHTIRVKFSEQKYIDIIFEKLFPVEQIATYGPNISQSLKAFLQLNKEVRSIDCFDVSHFQSSFLVGACIRFTEGIPDKNSFRRFKIKTLTRQNDYAALQEIVSRRYKNGNFPDLIMIDGGKGQRNAILSRVKDVPVISLAKRQEIIFSQNFPNGIKLDITKDVGKILIALRDYAHHFAISYHRKRRSRERIE